MDDFCAFVCVCVYILHVVCQWLIFPVYVLALCIVMRGLPGVFVLGGFACCVLAFTPCVWPTDGILNAKRQRHHVNSTPWPCHHKNHAQANPNEPGSVFYMLFADCLIRQDKHSRSNCHTVYFLFSSITLDGTWLTSLSDKFMLWSWYGYYVCGLDMADSFIPSVIAALFIQC